MTPSRTCFPLKGSIIRCSSACSRIHRSLCIDMPLLFRMEPPSGFRIHNAETDFS